jgi:hypothetical protein
MDALATIARRTSYGLAPRALLIGLALAMVTTTAASAQESGPPAVIEAAIRSDVATRAGVNEDEVWIARTAPVTWSDGCLGVYTSQTACTLALVDGYVVWAVAGGSGYRYHSDLASIVLFSTDGIDPASIGLAPLPEGAAPRDDDAGRILSGSIPQSGGFGLIVFGGGSYDQLLAASGCPAATARFWVTDAAGDFVVLVPASAVGAANAGFDAIFGGVITPLTPLIGTCPPA